MDYHQSFSNQNLNPNPESWIGNTFDTHSQMTDTSKRGPKSRDMYNYPVTVDYAPEDLF